MKRGVVLLNMGGPNSIDEVELFLRNMFADERILPMHPLLRRWIGRRIVRKRLDEARENYLRIGGKSPLNDLSRSLAQKVSALSGLPVEPVMRYVPPFASAALERLRTSGAEEIIAFPMYPHFSTTTTASSLDDLQAQMKRLGYRVPLRVIDPYFDHADYLAIVADRIAATLGDDRPERFDLILSAHGLPERIIKAGDPYRDQIEAHVRALEAVLSERELHFASVELAYQSRVGSGKWLEPNLIDRLRRPTNLNVMIYPLSFTLDNSETIFELDIEHREVADKIGYRDYRVVSCPNDHDDFARFISKIIDLDQVF
jgi:ferrochelatase